MLSSRKGLLAGFLAVLMLTQVTSAAISTWNGPNYLSGQTRTVNDAFEVPGNATVIDAWLHVDETGAVADGTGTTWTGEDIPGNFTLGTFSNSEMGKFENSLSLSPDSAVSNIDNFNSASLQLPSSWSTTGNLWQAINPAGMGGTVSGNSRILAHGTVPAAAADGGVVAATLPGQGLPANSQGRLVSPSFTLPSPINDFNMTFEHWYHFDSSSSGGGDGGWVEYKLDNGQWTYIEPTGGYPSTISANATVPNGANGSGFGVFASASHTAWHQSKFNLDNLSGISNATQMKFRFQAWTDTNNIARPGWFVDKFTVTNVGSPAGHWHHGCLVSSGTCGYSNSANAAISTGSIDLSSATSTVTMNFLSDWDLEGSSYDNWWAEASTDNTNWDDITSGAMTYSGTWGNSGVPGDGITWNGNSYTDDSGGFVSFSLDLPTSYQGDSSIWLRFRVQTDTSVQYGTPQDMREGATFDNLTLTDANGNTYYSNYFSNSTSMTASATGGNNDWQYPGAGTFLLSDSLESAQALPPGGWTVQNIAGQTGWEFGSLCSSYVDGPTAFPSANLGFATALCGDYDSSSDNSLISPSYSIPVGASARFVWKHWMCSEDGWDGGALFVSANGGSWNQAYVNYANGSNWYDGIMTSGGTQSLYNTDVWDGRNYQATTFGCSSSTPVVWQDMAYDVSNRSGSNVSFKFVFAADSAIQESGWYIDDIGLEVDWFETEGSWVSPPVPSSEYGYGFVDADIILPNNTWYGVSILDANGVVIDGHENMTLPLSLASIDRDLHPAVKIKVHLGTDDEYYSPLIRELSIGSTRYFGEGNGWNIPSNVARNQTGVWVNNGGFTSVIAGDSGITTRPTETVMVSGEFSQVTASLITRGSQSVSTSVNNSILDLGEMRSHISPRVTFAPGATIDQLAFRGDFMQPAHDASIDLGDDGTDDWIFPSDPAYGSYGWQTRIYDSTISHSSSYTIDAGNSDSLTVLIPEDAIARSVVLGFTPSVSGAMSAMSGSVYLATNWTTQTRHVELGSLSTTGTIQDSTGRNWSTIDIDFTASEDVEFTLGSFAISYTLFENISGLGQVVKDYHEANSNNGLEPLVDVPITWNAVAGGVGISGGVYHENMITNHPFTVPVTWYPNGELQGFTTQHHHLIDNDDIAEVHLIGTDSSGDQVTIILSDLSTGGVFTQTSGFGLLKLDNSTSLNETNGRWNIDWRFEVDWDWDDSPSMTWSAQGFDAAGEGLSPASAESGGIGTQASENDLQVDTWKVLDVYGHTLSDQFSPSYPFWAKSGSEVLVSGTVRFENTLDMRPMVDDFVVAVNVSGQNVVLNATTDGNWAGLVTLPMDGNITEIVPYVVRAGPIEGAAGAEDVTLQNPVEIRLDNQAPWVDNVQVNTGQKLVDADGFTWDPSSSLSLQVAITDSQALGDMITLHYWREGMDDADGNGIANPDEYQTYDKELPEGIAGERVVVFNGIDVMGLATNAKFSIWFSSLDYSGYSLSNGGSPGLENDLATMIIAVNEPTEILSTSLSLDTYDDYLLAGQNHTFSMEVSDANGISSVDLICVKLLGNEEDVVGVMTWEPRNGAMYTPEGSQITLHDIVVTEQQNNFLVEWKFSLDWMFDESMLQEYSIPSIVVYDDDELNPETVLTNLAEVRWMLDNDFEIVIEAMTDETPPLSVSSSEHIYVRPGDDISFSGQIQYANSDIILNDLPSSQDLEIEVSLVYGSEPISSFTVLEQSGNWSTSIILPSRSLQEGELAVQYNINSLPTTGQDLTTITTIITVDDISPVVQYTSVPVSIDDSELNSLPFTISIVESGGMSGDDLVVNWAFMRGGVVLDNGLGSATLPFISANAEYWAYSGIIDFTEGVNVSLEEGDTLIWWLEVVDLAGNSAGGTGLSMIDAMEPDFTVLSFDITITNIEIALANGSSPQGGKVVEGEAIGVTVYVRNLGTKTGTVSITLLEEMYDGRDWLEHGTSDLTLAPGQTLPTLTLYYETHGSGYQNLAVNITGMDRWINNGMLPHCAGIAGNASCDLDVESDMPTVISTEEANSGMGGTGFLLVIMGLLLAGMAVAIIVLLRRDKTESELYYDDEWEDDEEEVEHQFSEQKVTPILPPLAPERPTVLDEPKPEIKTDLVSEKEVVSEPIVEEEPDLDPWSDVNYSSDDNSEEE